jgi:hypothetical protein
LLQGWLDIGAMLSFCLLTCTFISLISSGSGRTQQQFQPCKQALPVVCKRADRLLRSDRLTIIFSFSKCFNSQRFFADTHFSTFAGSQNLDTDLTCKSAKILLGDTNTQK